LLHTNLSVDNELNHTEGNHHKPKYPDILERRNGGPSSYQILIRYIINTLPMIFQLVKFH
jgi:hypothetical protein